MTEHVHFVTGRLAARALRQVVEPLARELGIGHSIDVLPITVAALMTPAWIAHRVNAPGAATRVVIPGYCGGDLEPIESATGLPVERGPRDLRRLADHFGQTPPPADYGRYDIEILAEINHCPQLSLTEIRRMASALSADGADVIDVGCEPGDVWNGVTDAVRALRDDGHRVSIDSFNRSEIDVAVRAGAELVLSVNCSNRAAAADWGCEVVVVPDDPRSLAGLDDTIDQLAKSGVPLRIDPVLEPIGIGFAASLGRYLDIRKRYPDAEIMMGTGNLTELTDVDSAGVNTVLLGFCQELGIRSVLTTQVINWARSSVRECDLARRLMYHAVAHQVLPKHLEPRLVVLRDRQIDPLPVDQLDQLAIDLKDHNYRVFVAEGEVHLVSSGLHLHDPNPFVVMDRLLTSGRNKTMPKNLDPAHAFYLGYEMCKAVTAATLTKQYQQDEPLDWGFLTREEQRHYLRRDGPARRQDF